MLYMKGRMSETLGIPNFLYIFKGVEQKRSEANRGSTDHQPAECAVGG